MEYSLSLITRGTTIIAQVNGVGVAFATPLGNGDWLVNPGALRLTSEQDMRLALIEEQLRHTDTLSPESEVPTGD